MGSRKKVLILSSIEFLIHGALLGVGAYFVFGHLTETLKNANFNISVGGISISIGYNTIADLVEENIIQSIMLGLQLGLVIPLALGTCSSIFGMVGSCMGKSARCCYVMHGITATIMAVIYCILLLVCVGGLGVVNSALFEDGLKTVLNNIDLAGIAGKSAGLLQSPGSDKNDVLLLQPRDGHLDLEKVLAEHGDLIKNIDINALDNVIPDVDLSQLSFDTFDPKDTSQLEELGEALEGVNLETIVGDLTSNALKDIDVAAVLKDSGIKDGLNIVLGIGTAFNALLFALMVSSCVIACGTSGKIRSA